MRLRLLPLILVLLATSSALAQGLETDERGWPVGADPELVADAAVAVWLEREPVAIAELASLPAAEVCRRLPEALQAPPPPAGTRVVVEDRRRLEADRADDRRAYTYAAVRPGDVLDVVQVDLTEAEGAWRVERVGFRTTTELSGMRAWVQTPVASGAFVALTLLVLLGLVRPSPLRRGLALGLATAHRHRITVLLTMGLLYLTFALGAGAGAALPPECDTAVLAILTSAIDQVGAQQAYGSGDVARAATVTFYQNFVVVTFSVHFFLTLLLGVPSYLVAVPQFFVHGIPFGLLTGIPLAALLPALVLILIEFTAYFLVVSGGGIVLGTLFRRGFGAYPVAVRQAASLLVPAGLLLLAGAWYEAVLLVAFGP
jgi:hypothetical protein